MTDSPRRRIPEAAVGRLPIYLRILSDLAADGTTQISSDQLAELAGVNAAKVRKDLSYLGPTALVVSGTTCSTSRTRSSANSG